MNTDLQLTDPPVFEGKLPALPIAFNIEIAGVAMIPPATFIMGNMVHQDIKQALENQNVLSLGELSAASDFKPSPTGLVLAGPNTFFGLFFVSDQERGLSALQAELQRTGLFDSAETGWYSTEDFIWLRHQPKTDTSPFIPKVLTCQDHIVNTKLLETLTWFLKPRPLPPTP